MTPKVLARVDEASQELRVRAACGRFLDSDVSAGLDQRTGPAEGALGRRGRRSGAGRPDGSLHGQFNV